ncbi:hypothetical protein P8452_17523 [Trifolium repens]|nr:hypothetical protein P8452_17523 [Trifolium repens]
MATPLLLSCSLNLSFGTIKNKSCKYHGIYCKFWKLMKIVLCGPYIRQYRRAEMLYLIAQTYNYAGNVIDIGHSHHCQVQNVTLHV